MEDEEGYMALKPRPHKEASPRCSHVQRDEGVAKWSKQSKISLGILAAVCGFLGLALIGLLISYDLRITIGQVFQGSFHNKETAMDRNGTKNGMRHLKGLKRREDSSCTEDIVIHLCEPFTGNSQCKLCPINWTSLKEKCYWFSKEKKEWLWAYEDCARKRGQLLVVLDLNEMEFIQNITEENYPVWIGLNFTSLVKNWTWVDHSVLNHSLFSLPLPTAGISCGIVKGKQVRSEMCSAEFRWICEKKVIFF
ncbi:killer cell lectin-like receptor subfamily F member 1 [Eublepharis macularius]|uniref:Killer cell lectin-like receptor subfamily F member 1 n=1 Tax=Eublepharis macularius TaxID=481883 RepID=A0AA97KX47_EUBMA|nr:killer cell lectin-like receptor subfamily F member 1 [Eublepharis macularius]